jgi:predicted TIM-barrel fold metal-dependent hydrolase
MHPKVFETIRRGRKDYPLIERFMADPQAFVAWMDEIGLGRAGLINYVAPDIMGFGHDVNGWVARYRDAAPDRLIAFGGIHPPACDDVKEEMKRIVHEHRLDAVKIHPPHQALSPDAYINGDCPELAHVYEACQDAGLPIMFHTGTSIFPGARSRLGRALVLDDVAVDFPELRMILAHGGRPLWMDEAFFLLRRHPHVYMDISGMPPLSLLEYFPRLEEISHKALFGTDWPSPGVKNLASNLEQVRTLPLSEGAINRILFENAALLFPPRTV